MKLSKQQLKQFVRDGYVVLPALLDEEKLTGLRQVTNEHLQQRVEPFELETEVQYPGAPASTEAEGGRTIRRLLKAYQRHEIYKEVAENRTVVNSIRQLLSSEELYLNPNHHNCMMTKQPDYSSETHWHRDTRYWQFNNKYLINAWFALGDEKTENGGMWILPGSHRWDVSSESLDDAQFFRTDLESNQARLSLAEPVHLNAGDCLLFSAHCFHAAGANHTQQRKFSLVYTYHGEKTQGIDGTRSSRFEPIALTK